MTLAPSTLNMFPKFELAPILMYLGYVAEDFSALDNAITENRKALFEQYDVRRVLGDVDGAVHRYANVRGLECRTIVDAIAQKSDDVTLTMQGVDDCSLLRWRDLGEHRRCLG